MRQTHNYNETLTCGLSNGTNINGT